MDDKAAALAVTDREEATMAMAAALIDRFGKPDARRIADRQAIIAIGDVKVSWVMIGDGIRAL